MLPKGRFLFSFSAALFSRGFREHGGHVARLGVDLPGHDARVGCCRALRHEHPLAPRLRVPDPDLKPASGARQGLLRHMNRFRWSLSKKVHSPESVASSQRRRPEKRQGGYSPAIAMLQAAKLKRTMVFVSSCPIHGLPQHCMGHRSWRFQALKLWYNKPGVYDTPPWLTPQQAQDAPQMRVVQGSP